jgi:thymidylate kinase
MRMADQRAQQFVLDLLFRDRNCSKPNTEDINVSEVLDILRKNKIPLVHLFPSTGRKFSVLTETKEFVKEYEQEKAELKLQRNEYLRVKNRFRLAGIEDVLIKSAGYFPHKSDNLDVLVKKTKMSTAKKLLGEMGYVELRNMEEPYKYLFRKFDGGRSISAVHLHEKIAWITPFHDEALLWERYRKSPCDDSIDIPSIEDSMLIITAHWFYENKDLKLSDLANIYSLLEAGTIDWEKMRVIAWRFGWIDGFNLCTLIYAELFKQVLLKTTNLIPETVLTRAKQELPLFSCLFLNTLERDAPLVLPLRFSKVYCKLLHYKQIIRDKSEKGFYPKAKGLLLLTKYAIQVKLKQGYQPPFLVSFSGMDGSGKTTHARSLQKCFHACGIRNVYVWSRVGSSNALKLLSRFKYLLPFEGKNKSRKSIADAIRNDINYRPRRASLLRIAYVTILLTEITLQYFLRVKLPLLRNKVVICDRYVLDAIAEVYCRSCDSPKDIDKKLPTKIIRALTPRSDIAFLLEIPYDVACKEKEENRMDCGQISRQIALYHEMARSFGLDIMNARTDFRDLSAQISYKVLKPYYKRFDR